MAGHRAPGVTGAPLGMWIWRERGIQEVRERDLGHKWGYPRQCWLSKDMEASSEDNNTRVQAMIPQGWMGPQLRPCQ